MKIHFEVFSTYKKAKADQKIHGDVGDDFFCHVFLTKPTTTTGQSARNGTIKDFSPVNL